MQVPELSVVQVPGLDNVDAESFAQPLGGLPACLLVAYAHDRVRRSLVAATRGRSGAVLRFTPSSVKNSLHRSKLWKCRKLGVACALTVLDRVAPVGPAKLTLSVTLL